MRTFLKRERDGALGSVALPIILILLLALLIAQVGFWDALGAIVGAAAMLALFVLLVVAAALLGAYILFRRFRRGL